MPVSETILAHIYQSMCGLGEGEAGRKAQEIAVHYGVTKQTVFRWASLSGLRWRKEKSTKGKSKASGALLLNAALLQYASRRRSNEITLPACDAKELLEDSGVDTGVSTARFLTKLREQEISGKDLVRPAPHQTLLSLHPNHVWQFDVTNCLQYFLDDQKGMGERDMDMELYKNKIVKTARTIKKELLRYAAVDHCTGAFYFRYFYSSGERAIDGAEFLFEAMRPKDDIIKRTWNGGSDSKLNKYHFHGVPFLLIPDKGSIIIDKANQNLFKSLRMEVIPHLPGNPRAKGAVEGLMHLLNRFEARLKFQRPRELAELNRWALDWTIMYNGVKMMRGVAPRSAMWSTIRQDQLRLCPEKTIYRLLIRKPEVDCKCNGSMHYRLNGRTYQVPDSNASNKRVKVVINPYEYPKVEAHFNGQVWLLSPIEMDQYGRLTTGVTYGEFQGIKHTTTQKAKKEMEKIASEQYGLSWKGAGDKRIAVAPPVGYETQLQVFGHQADKVKVEFINRPGSELEVQLPAPLSEPIRTDASEVPRSILDRKISITEFLIEVRKSIGTIPPTLNQALRAEYGEGIGKYKSEEVIEEIKAGTWTHGSDDQKAAAM